MNNLPRVATLLCNDQESELKISYHESGSLTNTPPSHLVTDDDADNDFDNDGVIWLTFLQSVVKCLECRHLMKLSMATFTTLVANNCILR